MPALRRASSFSAIVSWRCRFLPASKACAKLHAMNSTLRIALAAALVALLPACTFVHMAPGAAAVKVLAAAPTGCQQRGEVEVSVKDSVLFYERNHLRVREELETLARNEAPGLGADTIHPLTGPDDGSQRFAAWRCRG
jgi:Domain of unknown function (DUF4156)